MIYHHSDFVATHACAYMMYSYTLVVPMNQIVLSKPSNERNISSHKWSTIRRVFKSHGSKMSIIYTCNHEKKYVTVHHTPACMSCQKTIVVIMGSAPCFRFHDYIYILRPSFFCKIWVLLVLMSRSIHNYLYIHIYIYKYIYIYIYIYI